MTPPPGPVPAGVCCDVRRVVFVMSLPDEPAAEAWRPGDLVDGRYQVLGELVRGGMSVVHRVQPWPGPRTWR